jgi:hypothetical protein
MKEYFAGIRCSGKNPPFMNLILKDGSPLKFLRVMDHVIKGIAIGQTNGIYYVMKLVAEVQPPPLTAEALEFERLYPQMAGAPGTGRVAPQQLMDIHNKVHILANNGTSNFFTDIYAGITCNVDVPFDAPDNGGKVLSQSMFVYEAGNVLFSEWLNSASPIQFHQAVQQWLLSFIVQSLVGFGHGDPHEANVVVCYFQPGGQWRYNIGDLSVFLPNNGFLLKMIDYDESDPNSNPLEGLQTLDVILGQTYPVLIGGRQQRNAEILPETMTFMADIAPLGKVKSTAEALEVIRRMNILTDLFVPTNAPILEEFNINVPLMAGDPTKARQAMGIDDQPQVPFSIPVPFGSFNSPPRTSGGSSMAFF